jgi:hypothetical protein
MQRTLTWKRPFQPVVGSQNSLVTVSLSLGCVSTTVTSQNVIPVYAVELDVAGALTLACKTLVMLSTSAPGTVRLLIEVQAWLADAIAEIDAKAKLEYSNLAILMKKREKQLNEI